MVCLSIFMDELIDIVDDFDNVIGQELKSVCHALGLRHRGAGILLFSDWNYNEILLQTRSRIKELNPRKLCFTGGHLKAGDSYYDGALRELHEEMFYGIDFPEYINLEDLFKVKYSDSSNKDNEFISVFRAVYIGPFSFDPREVEDAGFFDIDFLKEDILNNPKKYTGTTRVLFKEYLERYCK